LSFGLLVLFAISVGDLFRKASCLGRPAGKGKKGFRKPRLAGIGADKHRQDVRWPRAMQPGLRKIRGILATCRQSCGRFRALLLAFNQGF
jgi:hypothetical protein